ncbi:hypothetical protein C8J55DRAFT_99056 [Lentinula edodes]|uniref:Uncharacterized protein n=1 Tax=Lentinula lateritia TaxID=40482 RepID=A0A9W9E003_9AGAR|nr:hypothetical protein C8J55DRAFT_99056 [Lentinula edodes]
MTSGFDTSSLFVPFEGMYISFSFDIEKTLELNNCYPVDYAHLKEEVKNFPVLKYVGVLVDHTDLPLPQRKYHRVAIRPLQKGLNIPVPRFDIKQDMCTPVSPETDHPLARTFLELNKPLPWSGCYHPNFQDIEVRLPTELRDYRNAYELTDWGLWQMRDYLGEDFERRKLPLDSQEPVEISSVQPGSGSLLSMKQHNLAQSYPDSGLAIRIQGNELGPTQKLVIEGTDSDIPKLEFDIHHPAFAPIVEASRPNYVDNDAVFTPVVKFDSDIAALKDFPSGLELCRCLDALEALVRKCQQGPPLTLQVQGCITGAADLSTNEVATETNHLSKKKKYSKKLTRFASFLSKTQTFTAFRKPTQELKATIRDTRKSINDEGSSPKSMKNIVRDKLGLRNIVQGFLSP